MAALRRFARQRPVLGYYALVFVISWGGILILVAPGGIPGQPDDVARLFPLTLAALWAVVAGIGAVKRDELARGRSVSSAG